MRQVTRTIGILALLGAAAGCDDNNGGDINAPPAGPIATAISATGDITAKVNEYRALLGDPKNGGTTPPQAAGRREIGWDGVPANFNNGDNLFPGDFFNTSAKLGAILTTSGTGFRNDSSLFAGVDPSYSAEFNFFSANKIFAPVGSNQLDVTFRVPGTTTPALSNGFGAVFSDVDTPTATYLQYYANDGRLLGRYDVPVRSDATGLSFVGVKYDSVAVARVRITLGQGALGAGISDVSAGGTLDLVVVDDFLYGEPQPAQ
ncbi:MAG: hypothetical protein ACJ8DJ_06550 [Gemmatimonadales bacterium]